MTSQRLQSLQSTPSAVMVGHMTCAQDPYSKENPEGYINLGIAENHLMDDLLLPKLNKNLSLGSEHIQYSELAGLKSTREIFGKLLTSYFGISNVNSDNIVLNCGVSALCESLSFSLFDKNDTILIPAPYYAGFKYDFTKRFGCKFSPLYLCPNDEFTHTRSILDQVKVDNAKAIIITHPQNPTGEVICEEVQKEIISLCLKHNLLLISDEIYALSHHEGEKHSSLYEKAKNAGVNSILLYGMAKDFCLAGFKVGLAYTEDQKMLEALQSLSYFHPVGTPTQLMVEDLLKDDHFIASYLSEMQSRLKQTKERIINELPEFKFIPANAGMFLLLDLSHLCKTEQDEQELYQLLISIYKVNITPGMEQGMRDPGYFRVCYARKADVLDQFIQRMKLFLLESKPS